ncbi:MAG: family 16 glycosylhydrolase [Hyphomicrobiales bacterium]|nr:family 16 glycosylhydrolase [Hyphomicrobiales bacterium]MDE2115925.1 family 16 glycosylhydrolase [Hyphomicrobiales bacterium]
MNLTRSPLAILHFAFRLGHGLRLILPKQASKAFGPKRESGNQTIEKIYVINLDREPGRWSRIKKELRRIEDVFGNDLLGITDRQNAVDARSFLQDPPKDSDVDPYYTLADQLFVEPQPRALPSKFELEAPIRMSRAEVAVAKSHIEVWRRIAQCTQKYALILEDDVWFRAGFARQLDQAWKEVTTASGGSEGADILYVSYMEATNGAQKSFISSNVFRPVRGLWYMSGYILSRQGAEKLLSLLPCRGPIDLWINQKFNTLNVLATRRSIVSQRTDASSTNSYSILPTLTKIGAINSEGAALFNARPTQLPVFAFGPVNSGQSSLAMALSMLGYRCCSDLEGLPFHELKALREGRVDRVFNAYVNVGALVSMVEDLRRSYPQAKFIVTASPSDVSCQTIRGILASLDGANLVVFDPGAVSAWRILCDHLRCAPPLCPFPRLYDLGQRHIADTCGQTAFERNREIPKWDRSPWLVELDQNTWSGIQVVPQTPEGEENWGEADQSFGEFDPLLWSARSDTFTGNLALFRPLNVEYNRIKGATIFIRQEELGVRQFSAGALTSHADYLFGRFESTFRASDVPGVITGFFLHRNSPHQEIDIEIAGNMPTRLLVNVFYNPGGDGDRFDYGYRGSPSYIELGFDTSKGEHRYAIEWNPSEIRWLVDDLLVHRRVLWNPTPIPHLPMKLHFNAWVPRSSDLAGRLKTRRLPAMAHVRSIQVRAHSPNLLDKSERDISDSNETAISGVSM